MGLFSSFFRSFELQKLANFRWVFFVEKKHPWSERKKWRIWLRCYDVYFLWNELSIFFTSILSAARSKVRNATRELAQVALSSATWPVVSVNSISKSLGCWNIFLVLLLFPPFFSLHSIISEEKKSSISSKGVKLAVKSIFWPLGWRPGWRLGWPKKVANFESLDCNSPVGRGRINSADSHWGIALESASKGRFFLQFLWIFGIELPPRETQKWNFSWFFSRFIRPQFRGRNVGFPVQNSTSGFRVFPIKNQFFWSFSALRNWQKIDLTSNLTPLSSLFLPPLGPSVGVVRIGL